MLKARTRTAAGRIRIVVVERYPLVRAALRDILEDESDIEVMAAEPSVRIALEGLRDDPADVLLVHAALAGEELVPALQQLKRECPTCAVVVLGHRHDDNELFWAIQAGAAAHVADATRPQELLRIIRAVAAGEYLIDAEVAGRPVVARRVLDAFREAAYANVVLEDDVPRRALTRLTAREIEVLTAISEGSSNKQIALSLCISQHTVNNTVKAVLRKLAVNNRTRAVLLALRESWIPLRSSDRN
jgi:DNA-binding NarL/FixJ family response regulator